MVHPESLEGSSQSENRSSDFSITDASPTPITSYKLNGNNYLSWSQSVKLYVPAMTDSTYNKWLSENHMIMSWLLNSMVPEIGENFMIYTTASEIWDAARDTYFHTDNTPELFRIEKQIKGLRKSDLPVTQYFGVLTRFWQQTDMYELNEWTCAADIAFYKKLTNQKRVFQFLSGLNKEFDDARRRILATKPLPSVHEVFSEIRREESRRTLMLSEPMHTDKSALVTNISSNRKTCKPWCDHCRRVGHLVDQCWKLHGKPADWKPQRLRNQRVVSANLAVPSSSSTSTFSKQQLDELKQFFDSMVNPRDQPTVFSATEGNG
ncbi:hypothetical protein GQ457_02G025030 [Hibiscus cannabinus]